MRVAGEFLCGFSGNARNGCMELLIYLTFGGLNFMVNE